MKSIFILLALVASMQSHANELYARTKYTGPTSYPDSATFELSFFINDKKRKTPVKVEGKTRFHREVAAAAIDALGRQSRKRVYQTGSEINDWEITKLTPKTVIAILKQDHSDSDGDLPWPKDKLLKLSKWLQENSKGLILRAIFITSNFHSGTGIETNIIHNQVAGF